MTANPRTPAMGATEWAMLIALSVLWGGSFLFIGIAVKAVPPLTIVLARVGIAALALGCRSTAVSGSPSRSWASSTTSSPSA